MTPLPTESIAVISTAHVPEEEAQALQELMELGRTKGWLRRSGFMLWTGRVEPELPFTTYLLGYARSQGHEWLLLDADGEKLEELSQFDW
jgi:hypothetical protein